MESTRPRTIRLYDERQSYEYLGIGRTLFRKLVAQGRIKPVRICRALRFDVNDLDAFVETSKHGDDDSAPSEAAA